MSARNLKKVALSSLVTGAAVWTAIILTSTSTLTPPVVLADALKCDMSQYRAGSGLTAAMDQDVLTVSWNGQAGAELRARYAIDNGQPTIRELAVKKSGGQWSTLGQNLTPEY